MPNLVARKNHLYSLIIIPFMKNELCNPVLVPLKHCFTSNKWYVAAKSKVRTRNCNSFEI